MLIFVYTRLNDATRAEIRQQVSDFADVRFRSELPENELQAAFEQAEVVMGNVPPAWLARPPQTLQFWQLDSAGFDGYQNLRLSVPVANMGDFFAWPCAETIVAGIIGLYRHIHELAVLQYQRNWVGVPIRYKLGLLRQKRVVILGTGAIGQAVRKMLTGFDCTVKMLARTDPQADLHSVDELKAILPRTDLVINTLPGTAKGFFSAELIQAMPADGVYANIGRGSTTDESALIEALQQGRLGGAVLDVTATEPLLTDSPLWTMPNVILTQHTGGGQKAEDEGKAAQFLCNLQRFRNGDPLENQIDLSKGY
ncbi:D-isomer specific 2-hydroxyacid dehydrogenase NAD-binding protein [Fibrisoma limi BUZ 3]|uniref:D-isomer specific 2-hydroxyacid dehydrogenase NAD-binding protein n=1 Tax=Fibrisoma limi BUZ 3 TaxID=1185876 RepID=I2GHV0_9BACT|nr:D-2-hydroxyacid dehydrogenase [Fibrisoma limi]CCH53475.1 D-isomer specific 2-hydroxyacid dehydrogenase NAD-binding protein [Fibrisoma limi BUZ 3]